MDAAAAVRAARRASGASQAALARRAGVSARALAAVEAGTADPRWSTVARLVAAAGLELTVVPAGPDASRELREHLRRSTADRLKWSLTPRRRTSVSEQQWRQLGALTQQGPVRIDGVQAVGVWLPLRRAQRRLPVFLHRQDGGAQPWPDDLQVQLCPDPPPVGLVPVAAAVRQVLVPTPLQLAAHPDCGAWAAELRAAAHLLDADRARDFAGRRSPAHRDPRERGEFHKVLHRREHRDRALPSVYDSRAWRLGGWVGLPSWLQSHPQ